MRVARMVFSAVVLCATPDFLNLPRALAQPDHIEQLSLEAHRLQTLGNFPAAISLAEQAAELAKHEHGEKNAAYARYLNRLGSVYHDNAQWDRAENVYRMALELREAHDPSQVAVTSHNLGLLYDAMTKYAEAEPYLVRAVALYSATAGQDENLATSETALGLVYRNMGRFSDSEALMKGALARRKKAPDQLTNVANSLINLAGLYRQWSRYSEAESFAREALVIREKADGESSLEVARALNVLAESLRGQGRLNDAKTTIDRALAIRRAKLAATHPAIATSLNSLAGIYELQGRTASAEMAYKQALSLRVALGNTHLDLASTRAGLGGLYKSQRRYADAEPLLKSALAARQSGLGSRHPDVIATLSVLGDLYRQWGKPAEAKKYFDRVLELRKDAIRQIPVIYGTDRKRNGINTQAYGGERAHALSFGSANVWVPEQATVERATRRTITPRPKSVAEETTEPSRLVIQNVHGLDDTGIIGLAKTRLAQASLFPKQALLFVHGFNVSHENAIKRAAQVAYDLNFDGLILLFSWPSRGQNGLLNSVGALRHYPYDLASADQAVVHLLDFIRSISKAAPEKVHFIAHSLGNRPMLEALHLVSVNPSSVPGLKIGEVISAAPDVDVSRFRQLVPHIKKLNGTVTLYASSADWALRFSSSVWGDVSRAGLATAEDGPLVLADLDSIDITNAGSGVLSLNHDVYAASPAISRDIRTILESGLRPPDKRPGPFESKRGSQGAYWQYLLK